MGIRRGTRRRDWGMRMRHRNVWAAGLALGLGMGMVGLALGQEPPRSGPGLLDRLFAGNFTAPPVQNITRDAKKEDTPAPVVHRPRVSRQQALSDYLRRLDACDRLRQIADMNGDEELRNRAEVLQTRAKDIYVQRTNLGTANVDEEMLERKLAPNGRNLTPLTTPVGNGTGGPAFAEGRR